jgi:hypothetical protein
MNLMVCSPSLTTAGMRWLSRCSFIPASPEGTQIPTPNWTQSKSYDPHSQTTVKHRQSQIEAQWPWAIRKESTSVSSLIRVPCSGFSDLWKEPVIKWDKTGVQTRPSLWICHCCCLKQLKSGYRRQCVSEMKTDGFCISCLCGSLLYSFVARVQGFFTRLVRT